MPAPIWNPMTDSESPRCALQVEDRQPGSWDNSLGLKNRLECSALQTIWLSLAIPTCYAQWTLSISTYPKLSFQ